jgi:ParB family chromosome partitioning protein
VTAGEMVNNARAAIKGLEDPGKVLSNIRTLLKEANKGAPVFTGTVQRIIADEMQAKIRDYLIKNGYGDKSYNTRRLLGAYYAREQTAMKEKGVGMIHGRTVPIDKVRLGTRFRKDLGDVNSLARSIAEVGLLQPVVVTEDLQLIAGQRRLEACKLLDWRDIPAHIVNLREIVLGEYHENIARKDFTLSESVAIKKRIEETRIGHRPKEGKKVRNLHTFPRGSSAKVAAQYTGRGARTLQKAEVVVEAAEKHPERFGRMLKQLDAGETSVDHAYKVVKRAQGHKETKAPGTREFTRSALENHQPQNLQDAKDLIDALRQAWKQAENDRDLLQQQVDQLRVEVHGKV